MKAVKEGMEDSREVTFKYTVYVPPVLGEHKAEIVKDASTLSSGDRILVVVKELGLRNGPDPEGEQPRQCAGHQG